MSEAETKGNHGSEEEGLPDRDVTVNMLVGYNLAFFRKAAGMTQEELGTDLGWTKVAVSAAERSWDGKRVRQFDADLIADIAAVLGVPIAAMFLPPEDDGVRCRYRIGGGHEPSEQVTMRDLFPYVMSEPPPTDTPALRAYEQRFVSAVNRYLEPEAAEELAERARGLATEERLSVALGDARRNRRRIEGVSSALIQVIAALVADNELLQEILAKALEERRGEPDREQS